jgi:hypothetical protein
MKYKVGDKVRIVSKPVPDDSRGVDDHYWSSEMDNYCWKIMTITNIDFSDSFYDMKEDEWEWAWSDNMIEWLAKEEWKPKEGERVIVSDSGKWDTRIYLFTGKNWKYYCVHKNDEQDYIDHCTFRVTPWSYMEKIEEKKERKLMMTDSEWEKFQKNNNL